MMILRTISPVLILILMSVAATPLWADRDDRDDRKIQPQRQQAPKADAQDQRTRQVQPARPVMREATQPEKVRPPELARDPRTQPEKIRPPQTERVYRTLPEKQRPPEASREQRVVPPPAPIKNWRVDSSVPKTPPKPGYVLDARHRHNHYYPPQGHVETTLPPTRRVVVHNHVNYHYHNGIWYRPHNSHFIVVLPPIGIFVPFLPPFYSVVRLSPTTYYYYAAGVYYSWLPAYSTYVVVEAPPEDKVEVVSNGNGSDQLFIYPKLGQSEEQQARDRYDCHVWARSETGFDPTLPNGGVPPQQHASKRADYFRAMKACLEARHYSVQ